MAVIRNLDVVKRGVEEQLRTFAGRPSATTNELPSITAGERIEHIGNMSAKAIVEACDTTANDIEQAGQAALEIATVILNEAKQLAAVVRESGSTMSKHLQEFAVLAKKVSTTMRDTRAEVLNPQKAAPAS